MYSAGIMGSLTVCATALAWPRLSNESSARRCPRCDARMYSASKGSGFHAWCSGACGYDSDEFGNNLLTKDKQMKLIILIVMVGICNLAAAATLIRLLP